MQTVYGIFADARHGRVAVAKLFEVGVSNILRLGPDMLERPFEHIEEREGTFADHDSAYHDAQQEARGSFGTTEEHPLDARQQREGSFADHASTYHNVQSERHGSFADMELSEKLAADTLHRALRDIGLAEDEASTCVARIEQGATVVIVQASGEAADIARSILG